MMNKNLSAPGLWSGRLHQFEKLDSTNSWALEHVAELVEGDVVLAGAQTRGRGRFDRAWMSLPGRSLTLSLILKNPEWIPWASNLGQVAAVSVATLLERFQIQGQLKWPNDIMVNDRKISGILVDRAESAFVVGVGLNVNVTAAEFEQSGLDCSATSMAEAAGCQLTMGDVLTGFLEELERHLTLVREQGVSPLWTIWARHDWLFGRSIRLRGMDGDQTTGEYLGISPEGGIRVRTLEGYEKVFWAGDVERVITTP